MAINDVECCETFQTHEELLKVVSEKMPDEDKLYDLAELFKVFGDSTRIRILYVLFEAEVCVCDLAETLSMTQSAISHQLKILKQSKLVKSRREGKSVFYSLADGHVRTIIAQGREHIVSPSSSFLSLWDAVSIFRSSWTPPMMHCLTGDPKTMTPKTVG